MPSSPTVRRRRLAAELKRLRGSRTGSEVSKGVGWSTTKISRAESGKEALPPAEVEKLIDYYGVPDPMRGRLLGLAEDATQHGWWEDYSDALLAEYMDFIGLETEATSSRHWAIEAVPGLFQTEDYARELNAAYRTVDMLTPPGVFERFLEVRMRRHERLHREPALLFTVVLDEGVLLRQVGDPAVMHGQLARLLEVADLPNVELRIQPLRRTIALLLTSFTILSFGSDEDPGAASLGDVVTTESLNTDFWVEGEADTHLFRLFFDAIADAALPAAKSRDLIVTTMRREWC